MAKCVVRTDNLQATFDGSKLVTFRYNNGTDYSDALQNGRIVVLDGLISGEKEIWKGVKPTANDKTAAGIVLVAGVELMYDEHKHNLDEFENAAGADIRGYVLQKGDVFAVTADAFTSSEVPDLTTNKYLVTAGTGLIARASANTNAFAQLIAIEAEGGYTYYVLKVIA